VRLPAALLTVAALCLLLAGCPGDPSPPCRASTVAEWRPDPSPGYWACVVPSRSP
jgi:hypothetical protein